MLELCGVTKWCLPIGLAPWTKTLIFSIFLFELGISYRVKWRLDTCHLCWCSWCLFLSSGHWAQFGNYVWRLSILSPFFLCTSCPHPRSTTRLMLQVLLGDTLTINWQMVHQCLDVFIIEINFCNFNEFFHLIWRYLYPLEKKNLRNTMRSQ